jgi:hypothetical protein
MNCQKNRTGEPIAKQQSNFFVQGNCIEEYGSDERNTKHTSSRVGSAKFQL